MVEDAFTHQLAAALAADPNGDAYAEVIDALRNSDDRAVFDRSLALLSSPDPARRKVGVDVVAGFGRRHPTMLGDVGPVMAWDHPYPREAGDALLSLFAGEQEPCVLIALGFGLGELHDARACAPLAARRVHPDEDVRYAIVQGLLRHEDPVAIAALIALSTDTDDDVRDWATFGLGSQLDVDTPAIREALAARLDDAHSNTREEGLYGLAARGDERAVAPLSTLYEDHDGWALDEALCELAARTGDERLRQWVDWLWERETGRGTPLAPDRDAADERLLRAARRYDLAS